MAQQHAPPHNAQKPHVAAKVPGLKMDQGVRSLSLKEVTPMQQSATTQSQGQNLAARNGRLNQLQNLNSNKSLAGYSGAMQGTPTTQSSMKSGSLALGLHQNVVS